MKKQKFAIGAVLFWCILAISGAAWCGDNGNGTVTVNGLVWLKDAGCLGKMNWDAAMARPKSLAHGQCGLTDNSKAGDWRLPNINELSAIYSVKNQFTSVQAYYYWSSSAYAAKAWLVSMNGGSVYKLNKDFNFHVWPVRGGQ